MTPSWHFRPKRPGETIREPVHGEFFSSDAVGDPATALVREGIQNALDASRDDDCVSVRIYLSGQEAAVQATEQENWPDFPWAHYRAPRNGLNLDDLPDAAAPCDFLVFEDFSTIGLEGDPLAPFQPLDSEKKNRFYHFFRAEGQSDKEPSDRGSWGVGKQVFLRASRISTVFGLTMRRCDGRRMLMGKSVLKSHYLGTGEYCQDGYYGLPSQVDDGFVLPIENTAILDRFVEFFHLERKHQDTGLSVVVPWPHSELNDQALVQAVVRQYFYPILTGDLEVWVGTPSVPETVLDAENFLSQAKRLDPDYQGLIDLAAWAIGVGDADIVYLDKQPKEHSWQWSSSLLSDEELSALRERFNNGARVSVRVPVTVRKNDGESLHSHFSIYLERDRELGRQRPVFVRDGLVISDVKAPYTGGVRSLVVAESGALAEFLGRAENPSHTQWNGGSLKGKYPRGCVGNLGFVTNSVHRLVEILAEADQDEDTTLLDDVFFLPEAGKGGSDTVPPVVDVPTRQTGFRIDQRSGGFAVVSNKNGATLPSSLRIQAAYDVRRGNALKRYSTRDFDLGEKALQVDTRNVHITHCHGNELRVEILHEDFLVEATGFDQNRQLYVRVVEEEVTHGD